MARVAEPSGHRMVNRTTEAPSIRRTLAGLHRYRHLLRNLVLKDLKLKYRGSVIGFVWSLANPLLTAAIYTFAFRNILHVRAEGFVFYLMLGLLSWTFFANAAAMSTGAIVDNGGLVKSVRFPRAILPTATVLFTLAQYILTVLVFLPLMLVFYRIPPSLPMLLFPVFVVLQALFTIGVALVLATGTAFFRDVRHLVDVALMVLFWTTPIVYTIHDVSGRLPRLILLSPLSAFVTAYHNIFYDRQWPRPEVWTIAVTYTVVSLAIGLWLIVRYEDSFAERV
jgi:homopolymeric O-antigen transport system permease protein